MRSPNAAHLRYLAPFFVQTLLCEDYEEVLVITMQIFVFMCACVFCAKGNEHEVKLPGPI